jgi:4-amino-4-deoxy-L-arabinose transferase-like glycosyltransferase
VQKKNYYLLFLPVLVVYVVNLFVDVMAIDASQYAEMSWEMFTTHSFLKVHSLGADYLDKPPLLFWLNSLSFYFFGVGTVSYKLPSLLFALLAVYSTYRFAKIFYSEYTATIAALMLATTEALFLITNDVRTDTMLMGAVIFAIWQWAAFFETNKTQHLLLGGLGIGLALLAKGPIGLIAVSAALLPHIILSKKTRWLIDARLIAVVIIIALMLLPMCIGLYEQWGLKGLIFYFWTQSFGRITGASEWNNNPDTFFLIHTTAWAFLPWSLFLFIGWFDTVWGFIKNRKLPREIISISGFTLVLIALMLSRYQLPHYIFVVYPLAAVIAADYLVKLESQDAMKKVLSVIQLLTLLALIMLSCILQYCLKGADIISLTALIFLYTIVITAIVYMNRSVYTLRNASMYVKHKVQIIFGENKVLSPEVHVAFDIIYRNLFVLSAAIMIVFSLLMGAFYFPSILKYQPGDDFGRYARQHQPSEKNYVAYFAQYGFADVFYAQQTPYFIWNAKEFDDLLISKKHLIVLTSPVGIDQLNEAHIRYKIIEQRYHYQVAKLTFDFLNPRTRDAQCDKVFLVEADL